MPKSDAIKQESISNNNHYNIIDILLLDHSYLKECINIIQNEYDKKTKTSYARCFLDALKKHSLAEKKAVYAPLLEVKEFRAHILQSEVEHNIIDTKVKSLITKTKNNKSINEETWAELKVLSRIVELHLSEEEKEIIPTMRKIISKKILNQMGYQFMVIRKFSEKDLADKPELKEEIPYVARPAISPRIFAHITHDYFTHKTH